MTRNIFLFKDHNQHSKHTLLTGVDEQQAQELIESNKATEIDMSMYKGYRQDAINAHDEFLAEEQRIKEDDNPIMTDEVKAYELDKLRQQYVEQAQEIQKEYDEYVTKAKEEARVKAARATVSVSHQDEMTAKQVKNRLALKFADAGTNALNAGAVLHEATQEISLLTDAQKTALQGDVIPLLDMIEGEEPAKRALISELQDVRNMDLLSAKAAEQMPHDVLVEYRQAKVIRGWK